MGFGRMKYRAYSQKEWGLFVLPEAKRSSSETLHKRSGP